jgi:hypothetical protein
MLVTCFEVINLGVTHNINKSMMPVYEIYVVRSILNMHIMIKIILTV